MLSTSWSFFAVTVVLITLSRCPISGHATGWQPRYIRIEVGIPRKQLGSISLPFGSPWCNGKPTFWLIGHQPGDTERPWCLETTDNDDDDSSPQPHDFVDYDYTNSTWKLSDRTVMDRQDPLNKPDGPRNIDRHDCVTLDVNFDGTPDIACGVGANKGQGFGYNEVYLTDPPTGNITKVLRHHGLNRWPYMRNRIMITLRAADDELPLVLLAADGRPRTDGRSNIHRMFKLHPDPNKPHGFYFSHLPGPWNRHSIANCLHRVDVNQDGLDDVLMCQNQKVGRVFLQQTNGTFVQVRWSGPRTLDWSNARIADVTGDGIVDLIVVGDRGKTPNQPTSYIRIFEGLGTDPFFDFSDAGLWYQRRLPYATPDVEILDINQDGLADIYIVQADEDEPGTYCGRPFNASQWWGSQRAQPPPHFRPPFDEARDALLVRKASPRPNEHVFQWVWMLHKERGCGALAETYGNNYTMLLSHGNMDRPGYSGLLQWYPTN